MELPRPLRRVLVILAVALGVGAIGLGIGAMRSAAPTPVRAISQAAGGETSQPGPDLQAMLNGASKPAPPASRAAPAGSTAPGGTAGAIPAPGRTLRVHVAGAARHTGVYTLAAGA